MSQELHDKIFEEVEGISQEMFLAYQKGELSPEEMHKVEKLLIDSDFESEAMEGFDGYPNSTSQMHALNKEIEKRASSGRNNKVIFRYLAAACLAGVLISLFFVFDYKQELQQQKLAETISPAKREANEKEKESKKQAEITSLEKKEDDSTVPDGASSLISSGEAAGQNKQQEVLNIQNTSKSNMPIVEAETIEEAEEDYDELYDLEETESTNYELNYVAGNQAKKREKDKDIPASSVERTESVTTRRAKSAMGGNTAKKHSLAEPAFDDENRNAEQDRFMYVEGVDYKLSKQSNDYQPAPKKEEKQKTVSKSVPAAFENEDAMATEEKAFADEVTITKSYDYFIEKGIKQYHASQYKEAINTFDAILATYPNDANAEFYKGQSLYRLKQNERAIESFNRVIKNKDQTFAQEAEWYRVQALLNIGETKKAEKDLEKIVKEKGFYSKQAEKKLKELK